MSRTIRLLGLLVGVAIVAWLVAHADIGALLGVFRRIGWGFVAIVGVRAVSIVVDACPAKTIDGHIDSIQRGAGQAFGILPPENATGNYVKVVQRVPVKILLDRVPRNCVLGPGMSVEPTVKVR